MRIFLIAAVVLSFVAGAVGGEHDAWMELRFAMPESDQSGLLFETEDGGLGFDVLVQARVVGDPRALRIGSGEFGVFDDDDASSFTWAPLTAREVGIDLDGLDPVGRAGLFPLYRATLGNRNDRDENGAVWTGPFGEPWEWRVSPITAALPPITTPRIGASPMHWYKLRWSTTDLTPRTIVMDATGGVGSYYVAGDERSRLVQPFDLREAQPIRISLVEDGATGETVGSYEELPLCEFNNDRHVTDISDLLWFVDAWLRGSSSADVYREGVVDLRDLLLFVECWFAVTGGV